MVSFNFLVAYLIGGITLFPLTVLFFGLLYVIYSRVILPLQSIFLAKPRHDACQVDSSNSLATKDNNEDTNNNNSPLYKIGWLRVSRDEDQALPDASIGDMFKSYISGKANKRESANVYFAVLKYSTLYLYDSEKQLDSKGVIMLNQYTVKTHPPGLQDFELFSKPHLIKLSHAQDDDLSYYINCNRCIDKEDWFFAFIRGSKLPLSNQPQQTQHVDKTRFDQTAMNHLITMVYSDEHQFQTQWLNAILGRIFFGVYRTDDVKEALYKKVMSKLDKINSKRPPFLGEITVRSVDPGHALPRFTQPKLLGLSPTGELSAEAHLQYDGGFRIEIETELKWKYSDLLRPLTMDIVLGITLKEIQGKFLMKIKEPPTNRFWYGFYECPKMEWKVEPVVWEKRVGYSVVMKAIETKIQEFIMETMVLPNFDDITFFPTHGVGGIFEGSPDEVNIPEIITSKQQDKQDRQKHDEALLTSAKSLPELFSSVSSSTTNTTITASKLRDECHATSLPNVAMTSPITSPKLIPSDDHPDLTNQGVAVTGQIAISNPNHHLETFPPTSSSLSSSPDSMSSSPSSCTMDDSLRTLTQVLTDDTNMIVSPSTSTTLACDPTNTIQITYSQDYTTNQNDTHVVMDTPHVRLRKSSSLALLRPKTGASTAINVSPAMAHKKDMDSISTTVVSL